MNAPTIIRTAAQQRIEARFGKSIDQVIGEAYATGLTQDEIAAELGVSRSSVLRWMNRLGLETRRPGERVA
jgi:DNA-binding transcriptional regulator LsrR (DeoR family)